MVCLQAPRLRKFSGAFRADLYLSRLIRLDVSQRLPPIF